MNKVVYVSSFFKAVGKVKEIKVATGETTKGFFGGEKAVVRKEEKWEQTGWSDHEIDGARLAKDVAGAVAKLNDDGYEVVSISDVTSGRYNYAYQTSGGANCNGGWGYGYGYGYSITEGVMIVARKIAHGDESKAKANNLKASVAEDKQVSRSEAAASSGVAETAVLNAPIPNGACPNCDTVIPLASTKCPVCKAIFGESSAWSVKPLRDSYDGLN